MSEKLDLDNQAPTGGIPNQINIFWENQAGASDILTDGNKKITSTVFFHERLAPLKNSRNDDDRDRAVSAFKNWIPFSERETTIVLDGPINKITWAHKTKNGSPKRAVQKTYETYASHLKDTYKQLDLLEQGLKIAEDSDPLPNGPVIRQLIKSDAQFRALFADYFYHKEALDHYGQPKEKNRRNFFHGAVIAAAEHTDDETIKAMFEHIYLHSLHRQQYWANRIAEVTKLDFVKEALADPEFTPPSLMRRRRHPEEAGEFVQLEKVASHISEALSQGNWAAAMPPEVLASNIKRYAAKTAEIERIVSQGRIPQHTAELDVLGGKAIRDEKGNVIGVEARGEKQGYPPPGSYKPRANRAPESGPSDQRVEKDYWKQS